jgi:hypothetical protein
MQAGAGTTYIQPSATRKHKHIELEDEEDDGATARGPAEYRAQTGKRRKANNGIPAAAATFEPMVSFNAMSLDDIDIDADTSTQRPARRRQGTPHPEAEVVILPEPTQQVSPRASRKDTKMDRHDPERPHVVFVDSLSDSDDDDNGASTANSTLSDADTDDGDTSSGHRKQKRAIKINSRLRQHLQRQEALKRGPIVQELLADSPLKYGGAGIEERGLVLYRPLSFGIVEEVSDAEDTVTAAPCDLNIDEGPLIEEYGPDSQVEEADLDLDQDGMDID